ncbi:MAG: hypothetical protein ACOC4A_02200 [Spirochaetota bacterium]
MDAPDLERLGLLRVAQAMRGTVAEDEFLLLLPFATAREPLPSRVAVPSLLGPVAFYQLHGALLGSPIPLAESFVLVWPHVTGLTASLHRSAVPPPP